MGTARRLVEQYQETWHSGDREGLARVLENCTVVLNGKLVAAGSRDERLWYYLQMYAEHYRISRFDRRWYEAGDTAICETVARGQWFEAGVLVPVVFSWCEVGQADDAGKLVSLRIYMDGDLDWAKELARANPA